MLIITEFPQTILSHLTASSFYLLVMLRCSSPFLPFPCRSITMSCPCFLLDGSQLPDFRHKIRISIHTFPLSCLLPVVILQQFGYCIFWSPYTTVATTTPLLSLTQPQWKKWTSVSRTVVQNFRNSCSKYRGNLGCYISDLMSFKVNLASFFKATYLCTWTLAFFLSSCLPGIDITS